MPRAKIPAAPHMRPPALDPGPMTRSVADVEERVRRGHAKIEQERDQLRAAHHFTPDEARAKRRVSNAALGATLGGTQEAR